MSARLFPIMPGLCGTSDIAVSIIERQQLQHDQCVWLGHSERCGEFRAVWQSARELVELRFGHRDGTAGASSRMDALLNIHTEVLLPAFEFLGCHELDPHGLATIGNWLLELEVPGAVNCRVSQFLQSSAQRYLLATQPHDIQEKIDVLRSSCPLNHELHCLCARNHKLVGGRSEGMQEFQHVRPLWLRNHADLHCA
jgi:hypothetical protein